MRSSPTSVTWTDDGRWVYFRWLPGGSPWHTETALHRVAAQGGEPERLDDAAAREAASAGRAGSRFGSRGSW